MREASRLLIDDLQRAEPLLIAAHASQQQRFREHANLSEWRPQLVRYARNEVRPEARELALAAQLHHADDRERDAQREDPEQQGHALARWLTDEQRLGERRPQRDDALEPTEVVELEPPCVRRRVLLARLEDLVSAAVVHLHRE